MLILFHYLAPKCFCYLNFCLIVKELHHQSIILLLYLVVHFFCHFIETGSHIAVKSYFCMHHSIERRKNIIEIVIDDATI